MKNGPCGRIASYPPVAVPVVMMTYGSSPASRLNAAPSPTSAGSVIDAESYGAMTSQ